MSPRVVLGAPLYNGGEHLGHALESLLAQTFEDFRVVAVDDASTDATASVAAEYARSDPRLVIRTRSKRAGMTANWRAVFELGLSLHPGAEYFAWVSDHDVWHPRWLERLVAELDGHPEAVLAYPLSVAIAEDGRVVRAPWSFDTAGLRRPSERLRAATRGMLAGDMVYGLFRAGALRRAGVFRTVLWPDRLLLAELTAEGELRQAPELLWYRRSAVPATPARQRAAFFPRGAPLRARLPWWAGHVLALAGKALRAPRDRRGSGLRFATAYLLLAGREETARSVLRARNGAATRTIRSVPSLGRALGAVERAAARAGRPVKLRPAPEAPFDSIAMVNRHPSRP